MFEQRRPARRDEIARLIASFGVPEYNKQLATADAGEIATVAELGAVRTVLGGSALLSIVELDAVWAAGGGDPDRDQKSYRFHLKDAADPAFAPELLFEPTPRTKSGYWLVDGIHRAVALYAARMQTNTRELHLSIFVLPEPLGTN